MFNLQATLRKKLEKLCTKLPTNFKAECSDFVSNQLESIIDMLVAQIPPEEVCVLLNCCAPKTISDSAANEIGKGKINYSSYLFFS